MSMAAEIARAERDAEAAIRGSFAQVDSWHRAARSAPSRGSDLAADDADWLPLPMSEMARLKLDLAAEQLHQVKVMVEANELSLTTQRIVVRTALIAASIATWVLAPDAAAVRRARRRLLIEQTTFRHHQALTQHAELERATTLPVQPNLLRMIDHTSDRLDQIKQDRARNGDTDQWNETEIIRKAALHAFSRQPNAAALAAEAVLEFRFASGAAHGLGWDLFNSPGMRAAGPAYRHGRALMAATPAYSALADGYMAAYWIATSAWQLLETRGR
ncbi:MAG TPA: hypothetical protein VFS29_04890 [Motilibacteraceae bacterium]|nr:hypothetical protein [Motilibacteraceae bacterium]